MTRYEQGFIQKCAEYGVDGRALLEKLAYTPSLKELIRTSGSLEKGLRKLVSSLKRSRQPSVYGLGMNPSALDLLGMDIHYAADSKKARDAALRLLRTDLLKRKAGKMPTGDIDLAGVISGIVDKGRNSAGTGFGERLFREAYKTAKGMSLSSVKPETTKYFGKPMSRVNKAALEAVDYFGGKIDPAEFSRILRKMNK